MDTKVTLKDAAHDASEPAKKKQDLVWLTQNKNTSNIYEGRIEKQTDF